MSNKLADRFDQLSPDKRALLARKLAAAKPARSQTAAIPKLPRLEGENSFPVSLAQQRICFFEQLVANSSRYNCGYAYRLTGRLDIEALQRTLNDIVSRHEALRAVIQYEGEEPVMVIRPSWKLELPVCDWSMSNAATDADIDQLFASTSGKPFDLQNGPLVRAELYRLSEQEHILIWMSHHIVYDGWSGDVFLQEFAACYRAYTQGELPALAELPVQYPDYAVWQRKRLDEGGYDAQLTYWKRQLEGPLTPLSLAADRPRTAIQSVVNREAYPIVLSATLSQSLKELAKAEGCTVFMVLLAAYKLLLYAYSGQPDIIVGTPVANRNRAETEGLIGFFANTVALRTKLDDGMSFAELMRRVREVTLEANDYQDVPFEKIVEAVNPDRDPTRSPIFDAMMLFHKAEPEATALPNLMMTPIHGDKRRGTTDVTLALWEEEEAGIHGSLTYLSELFREETITRMIRHFEVILQRAVRQPKLPVSDLIALPEEEYSKLVTVWNDNRRAHAAFRPSHRLFEEQAARTPDHAAVMFEGQSLTYWELNERANRLAHRLLQLGVKPETTVGLYMDRSLDIMVGLLGILKAGGAYVPLDPKHPAERVAGVLRDAGVSLVIAQSELAQGLPEPERFTFIDLERDEAALNQLSADNPDVPLEDDTLMYVLFTSGSTGKPKGVAVEHRQWWNYVQGILERLQVPPGLHYAMVSTFAADLGTTMIWCAFATGGALHILPYERVADPDAFADYFRRFPIDVIKLVPSHFETLQTVNNPSDVLPRQRLIFAGEALHWETVERIRRLNPSCTIQNHYGPTETSVSVLAYPIAAEEQGDGKAVLPLGRPISNVCTYILNGHLQPVPIGVIGELYIGGDSVTRGYYKQPELTAERFVLNPFLPDSRMYRTGDLARYRSDGSIEFIGRIDHQVKIRGFRIETGEIEQVLLQHENVRDAVVIAREDQPGEKRLVAYIIPALQEHAEPPADGEQELSLPVEALRKHLKAKLPDYMMPAAFVPMKHIPLNTNGKIDRTALPAPDAPRLEGELVLPRNPLEEKLAAAWAEVLGVEPIGIDHNFFDIGGESFKAVKVVRKLGASFSVMDLFQYPTIRELAAYLSDSQEQAHQGKLLYELTRPIPAHTRTASLLCVPYGGGSAIAFQSLAQAMPAGYSLYALDVPGHDFSRPDEPLESFQTIAERCVAEIKERVTGPILLYGHCVGGALALQIALMLEKEHIPVQGLFMAGSFPSARLPGKLSEWWHKLFPRAKWTSDKIFRDMLRSFGGIDNEITPEEQRFIFRSLRHDAFEAEEFFTSLYAQPTCPKLAAPIACVVGEADRMTEFYEERFMEWQHFSDSVTLRAIPDAGHYFQKHQADQLAGIIAEQTGAWLSGESRPQKGEFGATAAKQGSAKASKGTSPSLKAFLLVTFSQIISMIGSSLTGFALGIWVYMQTGSVQDFAVISAFSLVPGIVLLPIAGAIVDRYDRRKIMLLSEVFALLTAVGIGVLLWLDALGMWQIYAASSITAVAGAFLRPAYQAAITQLIPKRYLGQANGLSQLATALSGMLAPVLAGMLIVVIQLEGILVLDIVSFSVSIAILARIRFPNTMFRRLEEPIVREIVGGWNYIMKRKSLVAMVVFFILTNFLMSLFTVLTTPLLLKFTTAGVLGTVSAAVGLGLLAGSISMSVWGGMERRADGMVGFVIMAGAAVALIGLRPSPLLIGIGLFSFGLALAFIESHWQSLIQTKVGLELQGRVFATNQMLAFVMRPLSFIIAGPLADNWFEPLLLEDGPLAGSVGLMLGTGPGRGIGLLILISGLVMFVWGILGMKYKPLRYMEDILPDAVPDSIIIRDKDKLQELADLQLSQSIKGQRGKEMTM